MGWRSSRRRRKPIRFQPDEESSIAARLSKYREQLLHRIRRRYQTVAEEMSCGPVRFLFTRVANPDGVLDEVAAEADLRDRLNGRRADGDALHLPYWAELWDSSRGIGAWLAEHPNSEGSRSVLDLGCGMGMIGTVAAALGDRVVFADLEPPALLFARLNSLPWRRRVTTRRVDWQCDKLDRRFDLILGADILYERDQWPWLDAFWRTHLAPCGEILLGEPGRQTGELFVDWIAERGWRLTVSEVAVSTRPKPIRLFRLADQSNLHN